MKRLFSTKYSAGAFNTALLILRFVAAGIMLKHGYEKLVDFDGTLKFVSSLFSSYAKVMTVLLIFAELFCAVLMLLGLFTRFACIPLIIAMLVAIIKVHHNDFIDKGETATLYLGCYIAILLLGPGRISIDSMIGK